MFNRLRFPAKHHQLRVPSSYCPKHTSRLYHTTTPTPIAVAKSQNTRPDHAVRDEEVTQTAVEGERELILKVMRTIPTQRELRHFLKRYIPPKEVVDSLLRPSHRHIALTKVQGPFVPAQLASVASTLVQLCRLGLTSVVVLENEEWACVQPNEPAEEEALRLSMLRESLAITEAIEKVGGRARPVTSDVFWEPEGDGWNEIKSASEGEQDTPTLRASLDLVQSALRNEQIPIILPIASFPGSIKRPVPANNAMVALCRSLAQPNHVIPTSSAILDSTLLPVKLVVINKEGGIPNHEKPGTAHSLINLVEEHDGIVHAYRSTPQWHNSHPTALQNLEMVRYCLALLPTTSSAIVVPCASLPHALISNLITDKPLYSSSLPTNRGGTPHLITTINTSHATVLRHGMSIAYHPSMDSVERPAMTALLEASFGRRLDANAFYERLERRLVCAIVAGGYEGAVIVTGEPAVGEVEAETEVGKYYYLDKFAIAPTSQGIGLTDILWKRMTDAYPDIMWRSRADNGVNKWYFERSDGNLRIPGTHWVMFWYGTQGQGQLRVYTDIARSIPASFFLTTRS